MTDANLLRECRELLAAEKRAVEVLERVALRVPMQSSDTHAFHDMLLGMRRQVDLVERAVEKLADVVAFEKVAHKWRVDQDETTCQACGASYEFADRKARCPTC